MKRSQLPYRFAAIAVATAALTWAACSDSSTGTDNGNGNGNGNGIPTDITPVSGNNQRIIVSGTLLEPLVVGVLDDGGDGVSGVIVMWSVTAGSACANSWPAMTWKLRWVERPAPMPRAQSARPWQSSEPC